MDWGNCCYDGTMTGTQKNHEYIELKGRHILSKVYIDVVLIHEVTFQYVLVEVNEFLRPLIQNKFLKLNLFTSSVTVNSLKFNP
jgi:hypothetical protein